MPAYQNLALREVQKLAVELASALADRKATIGLVGSLGSGKTTFIKAFAKRFRINQISSPTFVIAHQYKIPPPGTPPAKPWRTGKRFFYHIDLYRLRNAKQLAPLGLDEILNAQNVVLIEWADKFAAIKNQCDILITFRMNKNNTRDVTIKNL